MRSVVQFLDALTLPLLLPTEIFIRFSILSIVEIDLNIIQMSGNQIDEPAEISSGVTKFKVYSLDLNECCFVELPLYVMRLYDAFNEIHQWALSYLTFRQACQHTSIYFD